MANWARTTMASLTGRAPGVGVTCTTAGGGASDTHAIGRTKLAPTDPYWRRRLSVLVVGLAVFSVGAWGLSDALRVSHPAAGRARTGHGRAGRQAGHLPAAGHLAGGTGLGYGPGQSGHSRFGRPAPGQDGTPPTRSATSPGAAAGARSGSGSGTITPAFCSRRNIVLSVATGQQLYWPGQVPHFSLYVVSTQRNACSFNLGPGRLALVIRQGSARIWSSGNCVAKRGSQITVLRRGVPTVVSVTWHRLISSPGCGSASRPVPAGVYSAYAVDGRLVSSPDRIRFG